jgi:tRNA(Arg) A34 adenosine deaminase TadA
MLIHKCSSMRFLKGTPVKIANADQAVGVAAARAIEASLQNTFAVGGALIDNRSAKVICSLHNNVLESFEGRKSFLLHDPTAHGERQLVDWYFEHRKRLKLSPPEKLTIVTTLDPCAMCAGALLTAGFNVAVSAIDNYAGINYNASFDFPSLPADLRKKAQSTFAYYGVDAPVNRAYRGRDSVVFARGKIRAATLCLTDTIFESSVNSVRSLDSNSGNDPSNLTDPSTLPPKSPVKKAFLRAFPQTFSLKVPTPRMPGKELGPILVEVANRARSRGAAFNSTAFLDSFGNLLLCLGGAETLSPIRTAFMEITRTYAHIRWVLMNSRNPATRDEALKTLTHPKYGTFVFLYAPDPNTPQGIMAMGAYGSTMEGPIPQIYPSNFQYVLLPEGVGKTQVGRAAMSLPPFYTTGVQVAPTQVIDDALVAEVTQLLS